MWRVGSLLGGVACMIAAGWIGYSYRAGDTLFEPILAFLAYSALGHSPKPKPLRLSREQPCSTPTM